MCVQSAEHSAAYCYGCCNGNIAIAYCCYPLSHLELLLANMASCH